MWYVAGIGERVEFEVLNIWERGEDTELKSEFEFMDFGIVRMYSDGGGYGTNV